MWGEPRAPQPGSGEMLLAQITALGEDAIRRLLPPAASFDFSVERQPGSLDRSGPVLRSSVEP